MYASTFLFDNLFVIYSVFESQTLDTKPIKHQPTLSNSCCPDHSLYYNIRELYLHIYIYI